MIRKEPKLCHTQSHCHTERSEVSHNTESKRDFSLFSKAQNDKKGITQNDKAHTCHTQALPPCHTERSEVSTIESRFFANAQNDKKGVSYKPSGIEWLGEIPQSWEIKPLQAIFNQRNEQNNNLEIQTILSLVKDVGVIPYEEKGNVGNKAKDDLQNYKIARVNDLVLNKMNAVIGSLGVSKYDV